MTKEELIANITKNTGMGNVSVRTVLKILVEFFKDKVIIQRGENRHPYADVLHEMAEGAEFEMWDERNSKWSYGNPKYYHKEIYRIKPSEPIYEWMWYDETGDIKWWTKDESSNYNGTNDYFRADQTKRIR